MTILSPPPVMSTTATYLMSEKFGKGVAVVVVTKLLGSTGSFGGDKNDSFKREPTSLLS